MGDQWEALFASGKLIIASSVVAAVVSGVVAVITTRLKANTDREAIERRVAADIQMAVQRVEADRHKIMSDKAWADHELRRDAYIEIARQIDCIFVDGDDTRRAELHRTARRVRLVGCDHVVRALNALFDAIKEGQQHDILEKRYRSLFNAMRHDVRQVHSMPTEGTDLGDDAFPIES